MSALLANNRLRHLLDSNAFLSVPRILLFVAVFIAHVTGCMRDGQMAVVHSEVPRAGTLAFQGLL